MKFHVYYIVSKRTLRYPHYENVERLRFISLDGKRSYFRNTHFGIYDKWSELDPKIRISVYLSCFCRPWDEDFNKIHVKISAKIYDRKNELSSTYLGIWDLGESLRLMD